MRKNGAPQTHITRWTDYGTLVCGDKTVANQMHVIVTSIRLPATSSAPNIIVEIDADELAYCWIITRKTGKRELHPTSSVGYNNLAAGTPTTVDGISVKITLMASSSATGGATIAASEV